MNRTRKDVIVVGGGVIGCFAALHLARRGCDVTIVERAEVGSGASFGNCGYVCPSHVNPLCAPGAILSGLRTLVKFGGALSIPPRWDPTLWRWLLRFAKHCNASDFHRASLARQALLQSSRDQYQQIADEHAAKIGWQSNGLLNVYRSPRDFESFRSAADRLRGEFGIRVDSYEGDALCRLVPELRQGMAGGWYYPDDAHLSPNRLLQHLRDELLRAGVSIREQTGIADLRFERGRLASLRCERGESLTADRFVIATGAETGRFGRQLGCEIPIVPGKGFSVTLSDSTGMPVIPMIFEDDHVAVTRFGDSFRIGSTMQLTGFSRSVPESRIRLLKRAAERHLRAPLPRCGELKWSGWRPLMADGLPMIGKAPGAENVFISAGNGMVGIATAPATGQLLAECLTGGVPHIDPTPFRTDRFHNHRAAV